MDRRNILRAGMAGLLAPVATRAVAASHVASRSDASRTFVLVPGAWHGGWCWREVADWLRAAGHRVYTPTLTGLGERRHLISRAITLETFVEDLENLFVYEELADVVLVGHSFGGLPISGLADRMPEWIAHLIYLDSVLLESGVSFFSTLELADLARRLRVAQDVALGIAMPPPPLAFLGIPESHPRAAWVKRQMTPHPIGTYESALTLRHPIGNGRPRTYVHCTQPSLAALEPSRALVKRQANWRWAEIATGHDAMILVPDQLAALLLKLA